METQNEFEFVVKVSAAKMPGSSRGTYKRVAVLQVVKGTTPSMISPRARGVVRVVRTWEKLNVGTTERCAYNRALREAETLCAELSS